MNPEREVLLLRPFAELVVTWDGRSEDGCIMCGADYVGDAQYLIHEKDCPIPGARLQFIERLMDGDPAPDSREGRRLLALTEAQQYHEKNTP